MPWKKVHSCKKSWSAYSKLRAHPRLTILLLIDFSITHLVAYVGFPSSCLTALPSMIYVALSLMCFSPPPLVCISSVWFYTQRQVALSCQFAYLLSPRAPHCSLRGVPLPTMLLAPTLGLYVCSAPPHPVLLPSPMLSVLSLIPNHVLLPSSTCIKKQGKGIISPKNDNAWAETKYLYCELWSSTLSTSLQSAYINARDPVGMEKQAMNIKTNEGL